MQFYEVFYKRFGVRTPQQLMTPIVSTIDKFDFPKNSIYHFVAFDNVHYGPSSDDYLFRNVTKQILMDHVVSLTDNKGIPKKVSVQILPYIREFHMKNRRFRYLKEVTATSRDENTLTVVNYGFVLKIYRYARSLYTEYYKWWNIQKTLWDNIAVVAKESDRQQYIFCDLPKTLPSVTTLNIYSNVFNQQMTKIFNTSESLFLLELWKWLGEDTRKSSVMSSLDSTDFSKVNIVYQDSGKWIIFNLGVINSWRYLATDEVTESQKFKIPPDQLQRRFLRLMMSFMSYRSNVDEVVETEIEDQDIPNEEVTLVNTAPIEIDTSTNIEIAIDPETNTKVDESEETKLQKSDRLLNSLDDDLKELEVLESKVQIIEEENKVTDQKQKVFTDKVINFDELEIETKPEDNVVKYCDEMAENGMITAAEYRGLIKQSQLYKSIKAPLNPDKTLVDFAKIETSEVEIQGSSEMTDIKTVIDKSMLKSSLLDFDERYITKVLAKDVSGMVINVQKAGIILSNYDVERITDVMGDYENHAMRIRPIQGVASTIRFRLPVVNEDGVFTSNGNKYTMRKQRGDMPIRKIAPDIVALTSYYGKSFVKRNSKKVNDYSQWFRNKIMSKGLDTSDNDITNLAPADVFDNLFQCPRIYSIVAQGFKSFTAGNFHFIFDHKECEKQFSPEVLQANEKDGMVVIGYTDIGTYLVVDKQDAIYETSKTGLIFKGNLDTILKIDSIIAPVEYSEIKIFGKAIAVGLILAYQIGLTKLMDILKVSPRRVLAGQRLNLEAQEYGITFSDETLIFSKDDKLATVILAGFNEYSKPLRNFSVYTFDNPNVYLNVLETSGISARYLREVDLMTDLFVDPITKELLVEMGEPTTFRGLLVRSSEMLLLDQHPDQSDMRYMRIKGYERLSGAVYTELVRSIRDQKSKSGKNKAAIELHPYAVWKRIAQDPSITIVTDINPIQNLKEKEAVTYAGEGGRNSRSMTKNSRMYHKNDMGIISESTVDSSDVAINVFTSADPQFKSLRGTSKPYVIGETGATALISTSALLAVGSDRDDPKRVNFIAIQQGHGIACTGYKQAAVRTGYEQVLAQRTSDLFAYSARQDGRVISKTNTGIVIEYADGTRKGIEIGRRFGQAAGLTIPHDVVSEMKAGDGFKKGDIVCYNVGFFEKDILNKNNVIWKAGITVKTVLYESSQTLEDASSISRRLADQLSTKTTKMKTILVTFDQQIRNLVKVDDHVESETVLCIIEDAITSNSNLFDEDSLNTLKMLSGQTPTAKAKGTIDKIEVFYHGDKEDMSDSIRELANLSDREMTKRSRSAGKNPFTGSVTSDFRVDSEPLALDSAAIRIYITSDVSAGVGD